MRRRKQFGKAEAPECVQRYNASLAAYVEAIHEGRLDLQAIGGHIADLDAVKGYSDEDGSITLDFSTKQAEMLVEMVVGYTKQLAQDNAVDLDELEDRVSPDGAGTVIDLRRHLEVQSHIFSEAS